jgi:hypothetical protein
MGNPLPVEILSIYTESNGLQKLLTYFLDNLSTSINGIKKQFSLDRHEFFRCFLPPILHFQRVGTFISTSLFSLVNMIPNKCNYNFNRIGELVMHFNFQKWDIRPFFYV